MYEKSKKLDHVGYDIRGPVTDTADRMIRDGIKILKLNTGNPAPFGFKAPASLHEELITNLRLAEGYSDSLGILPAREAIAAYCRSKEILNVSIDDIYTGNGVSELISISMQALLDSGDEILIPTPDYPLWTASATLAGGSVVHYVCDEQAEWYPDIADIRSKVNSRTKAIVVINPNNPTGALYPVEILEQIVEIAREHKLIIFCDEIYDRLVMDGLKHTSIASLAPDLFTVTLNGLSKSHMIAGYRCGWMSLSGNKEMAKGYIQGLKMLSSMRLCSNVLSQVIIKTALDNVKDSEPYLLPGGRIYEQREFIVNAINRIPGLSVVKPKAAFYAFPRIDTKKFRITDDEQFVVDFLNTHHILMTHGGGFHWPEPNHFRLVYLPEMADLEIVAERLGLFLETYHQGSSR